jgi:phage-related protein
MSNAIPPIMVQIAADVSQLKAGLAQAESSIKGMNSTVATANTGMQNMIGTAKRMAGAMGIAFAGQQVLQFGKDVVMSASSMNESISKVNVVFGQGADAVFKFGDSAAKNMGMSNQAAIEAAGTYGNLFQAFGIGQSKAGEMSTTLVQLAADLGSFNNTSTEEAINALRSGLAGETEPLKRFGVALNEVTLKNKAFEMGFGTIKGAMDPAIKAQVTYALVMEQTKLAQGDYERTASGTANTMKTLSAQFADAKVAIGDLVLPAFNALLKVTGLIIPVIKKMADFFKDNKDALKMLAIIAVTATTAFYAYKAAVVVTSAFSAAYTAILAAQTRGFTLAQIATFNLKVAFTLLTAAMKANPIGLIVVALTALAAGFVYAWKHSETFRGIVIKGIQIILNGFALLVQGIGKFVGMLAKVPGMGWAKGIAAGADKASESIKTTAKNLSDLKIAGSGYGANAFTYGSGSGSGSGANDKGKNNPLNPADAKKKADDIKKAMSDVAGVYKDMNKVIADSQDKVAQATKRRDEDTAKAHKQYNESIAKADKTLLEATAAAYKRNTEQVDAINKDYAKRKIDLEFKLQETLTDIRQKAAEKSADIIQKSNDKQQKIIQQSMDRLRNAFASKTGFSLADAFGMDEFGGNASGDQILGSLKQRLADAQQLAKNAATLQGKGFSQTFIEQVVAAGPGVGNKLAQSILDSSPESIKELQLTFNEMERTSTSGLDALAATMNSGGKLATQELMDAYAQVSIDLRESLTEINSDMVKALAEANADYSRAMAEAKAERDDKLAEAAKDLMEALAEADKNYKEAIADATKTLTETLADVQKTYNEALDQIAKDTQERIDALREKLIELAKTLADLGAKQASINAIQNAPVYTPVVPAYSGSGVNTNTIEGINKASGFNITQNITNSTPDAKATLDATLSAIKFGTSGGYTYVGSMGRL